MLHLAFLLQTKLEDMGEEICGQAAAPRGQFTQEQRRELAGMRTWILARLHNEVSAWVVWVLGLCMWPGYVQMARLQAKL